MSAKKKLEYSKVSVHEKKLRHSKVSAQEKKLTATHSKVVLSAREKKLKHSRVSEKQDNTTSDTPYARKKNIRAQQGSSK